MSFFAARQNYRRAALAFALILRASIGHAGRRENQIFLISWRLRAGPGVRNRRDWAAATGRAGATGRRIASRAVRTAG